jgi:uncharacterized membrane protein
MNYLLLGMLLFFTAHSVRIVADDWRAARIARMGEQTWKGMIALVSLVGFALMVWGYGETRAMPELWNPPLWTRHLASLLTLPAFVLLVAAYVPNTRIKAAVGHPMVLGVMLWAFAHLVSNGRAGDLLLFGVFLVWAAVDYLSARGRDRSTGTRYTAGPWARDAAAVVVGVVAWALFAKWGHVWLMGVAPFA